MERTKSGRRSSSDSRRSASLRICPSQEPGPSPFFSLSQLAFHLRASRKPANPVQKSYILLQHFREKPNFDSSNSPRRRTREPFRASLLFSVFMRLLTLTSKQ